MKELQAIINAKVKAMSDDGTIEHAIEESIEKTVKETIKRELESYGSISQVIRDTIKEGLVLDLKAIDFESYNQQMLVAIKQHFGTFFADLASEKFLSGLENLLTPAPKEISIQELCETIVKGWRKEVDWDSDVDENATVTIDVWEHSSSGDDYKVRLFKKEENGYGSRRLASMDAAFDLFINVDSGIRISHRQSYNPTCFSADEALIFKLYAAGTKITGLADADPDNWNLELKGEEY